MHQPQQQYDIIIVGAGISGQSCAKVLANSDYSVLLIDSNPHFFNKLCAGGITPKDLTLIPRQYVYRDLQPVTISYGNSFFKTNEDVIASFNREQYLSDGIKELRRSTNIDIHIPLSMVGITDKNSIIVDDRREIRYNYLIGADGSSSKIRQHLGLSRKHLAIGMQVVTQGKLSKPFEFILDDNVAGYLWIFPHKDFAKVGTVGILDSNQPDKLREKLMSFIKNNSIPIQHNSFQSSIILTDFRGYSFGNIYLAGDAAGCTPALTWEGIYPAIISGKTIGEEILNKTTDSIWHTKLKRHLQKKAILDSFSKLLLHRSSRKLFFNLGMKTIKVPRINTVIMKVAL